MTNIPSHIQEIYRELHPEVVWLHARWKVYRQLFGTSERRIDLLNESAASAFYVFQELLFADVQIALSRLTDPPRVGRNENLSLDQLQLRVEAVNGELAEILRPLLDQIHTRCAAFRAHRNQRLVHFDLETALRTGARQLPSVSRRMIEEALTSIRTYMNTIQGHYDDTETGYEHFIMHGTDGDALVWLLVKGLRYEELSDNGTIPHDDETEGSWRDIFQD
jgi:hypothetical protein